MSPFDQTIEHMALKLQQAEDTSILFGVTDDTVLRDHALEALRKRLSAEITLREFRYDAERLQLARRRRGSHSFRRRTARGFCDGARSAPRDKRTEAIQLLNLQRNRFGRTSIAVILWVNRAILAEISTQAPDFYSWRSVTLSSNRRQAGTLWRVCGGATYKPLSRIVSTSISKGLPLCAVDRSYRCAWTISSSRCALSNRSNQQIARHS